MLVRMQFKLAYFSVGLYLIITEKTQTSWDIWLSVMLRGFYSDSLKIIICTVMKATCVWLKPAPFLIYPMESDLEQ